MFAGVIESKSHEGGFLVSFTGSSPALEAIIINAESGIYIGKVDAVIGNTNAPLAHVAHIDRKLDLDSLVGIEVGIRAKKQREERERSFDKGRRDQDSDRGRSGGDQGYQSRDRQGGRPERNDRGQNNRNGGDWDCPKCRNNNFAFRTECNSCGLPRSGGNDRRGGDDRRGGNDRRGGDGKIYTDNDWDCPKCQNSNFAFRQECNRCEAPRPGGGGGGGGRPPRRDDRSRAPRRDDGGRPPRRDDRSQAPRRDDGGRPPRRDDSGGNQSRGSYGQDRAPQRTSREPRTFRKSRGNGPGHAHNRPPKPIGTPDRDGRPPQREERSHSPRRDDDGARPPPRQDGARPPRRDGRDRRSDY